LRPSDSPRAAESSAAQGLFRFFLRLPVKPYMRTYLHSVKKLKNDIIHPVLFAAKLLTAIEII
jgi:hypothetical protein